MSRPRRSSHGAEASAELVETLGGKEWSGRIDLDALLVALVLVPHSYPRNRFFSLYRWTRAGRVRRRASRLRSVISDICSEGASELAIERDGQGDTILCYRLSELGGRRAVRMTDRELAIVKIAVHRHQLDGDSAVAQLGKLLERVDATSVEATLTHLFPK